MTTYQKISIVIVDEIWTVGYNFVPIKFERCVLVCRLAPVRVTCQVIVSLFLSGQL